MEKRKLKLFKSGLISLKKPGKNIPLFLKDSNLSQRNNTLEKKDKNIEKNDISKFSKIITLSNPYIKKQLLMKNNKRKSNKKAYSKQQPTNLVKDNFVKKVKNINKIIKKCSYTKIQYSNNKTCSNRTLSRNKIYNKNNGNDFKNNNYSLNVLSHNIKNKVNKELNKTINKNDSSLNYSYKKFKNKFYNKNSKKIFININSVIPLKKINAINTLYDLNNSNKNINKKFINISDFKKFNRELLKRKLKEYKTNKTIKNNNLINIYPSIQSSIRIPKKESFISNKNETNNLDYKRKNKSKESKKKYNIKRKENKIFILNNSKTITNSNDLKTIINRSYSINHLYNKYKIRKYNINLFYNINNHKRQKLFLNKKGKINYNIFDINYGNNTSKNKKHKSFKKLRHDIINLRIDNTINNIVNINNNLNGVQFLSTNSNTNINKNKIVYTDKNNIYKNKERDSMKNKIKNSINKQLINPYKLYIRKEGNKLNDKNRKNKSLKSLSLRKRKNKNKKNKSNHNLIYLNLIEKNNIKKLQNKKYRSRNKIYQKNKDKDSILNEKIKIIREKQKKRANLSITSIITMKINSDIKLQGLKTIFNNFYNVEKKQCLSYRTPKIKKLCSFHSLNYLNISLRYNKTEEKIDNLYKNRKKNEKNDAKNKYYNKIISNPQYSIEYIDEMLQNLLIEENNYFEELNFDSFNLNNSFKYCINPESWKFFINSLINIQEILYFDDHTLFSTIQIFDKYISQILFNETKEKIDEENLDIVIVTSLIIASKKEEIKLFPMKDYLNILPDKYTIKDLIKQENDILYKFNFNIFKPNILDFFEIFAIICKLDNMQRFKGLYLLNIILLDCYLLKIPPSLLAFCVTKIICKYNIKKYLISRVSSRYIKENNIKEIKVLKILNKYNLIDNICEYIQYIEQNIKFSNYDSAMKKFNTIKYY